LNPCTVEGLQLDAIGFHEWTERANGPILLLNRPFKRTIVCPGSLKAQSAFQPTGLVGGHLLEELWNSRGVGAAGVELGKGKNCLENESTLKRRDQFSSRHVEILAAQPPVIACDAE
jgi:hypothetical protein